MYKKIVVPIDSSELAVDTVAKAVMFAKIMGAKIIFLHALVDFGASDEGALLHSFAPTQFAELVKGEASAVLSVAEVEARRLGVSHQSVVRSTRRPYQAILDVAEEFDADLIFMASHGRRGVKGLLMGSQTEKVLAHTKVPVLVSRIESNAETPDMDKALSIIKGEHRSLAATVHAFQWILGRAMNENEPADVPLMRSMHFYFRSFTARLHHPKEDDFLFPLLQARTREADDTIEILQKHHAEEAGMLAKIDEAINAYELDCSSKCLKEIAASVDSYAERVWEHARAEENIVLPLCQRHLLTQDWEKIASAFEANGDPSLDLDLKGGYQKLFVRLMNIVRDNAASPPVV
jgi:nucleotide-binding universal stress UspA family protein/hemerythrin-like domain-containing protein